jgi:hypothetical protein
MIVFLKVLDSFWQSQTFDLDFRCAVQIFKSIGRSGFSSGFLFVLNLFQITIKYLFNKHLKDKAKITDLNSVADPGSGAFLTPGSGSGIRDELCGSLKFCYVQGNWFHCRTYRVTLPP